MKNIHSQPKTRQTAPAGFTMIQVLITSLLLISLGVILATAAVFNFQYASYIQKSYDAGDIAEAGVNYYLWHLSHNVNDYCDGGSCGSADANGFYGPFHHTYTDSSGKTAGTYDLYIKPPANYATTVTVKSVGRVTGLRTSRVIQAQLAIPSMAAYSLLTGTEAWVGPHETFNGPVHSNVGLHIDGTVSAPATAALSTYTPGSSFGGDGKVHPGIWGNGGPTANWQYPVQAVDFNAVTTNLQQLKTSAQSGGKYLASSGKKGYLLYLKADGSIDAYKVTAENCNGQHLTKQFYQNIAKPANGILFVEDDVWVQSNGTQPNVDKYPGRLTIATGRFPATPSTYTTITIYGDILYAAKDGTTAIGLIAQKDIKVSQFAPSTIEVDAALLAQTGHVWYNSGTLGNNGNCGTSVKTSILSYGSIASYDYWTWTWVNGSGATTDGYTTTTNNYDTNLKFNPPPGFPTLTTGAFSILNYRELLGGP